MCRTTRTPGSAEHLVNKCPDRCRYPRLRTNKTPSTSGTGFRRFHTIGIAALQRHTPLDRCRTTRSPTDRNSGSFEFASHNPHTTGTGFVPGRRHPRLRRQSLQTESTGRYRRRFAPVAEPHTIRSRSRIPYPPPLESRHPRQCILGWSSWTRRIGCCTTGSTAPFRTPQAAPF